MKLTFAEAHALFDYDPETGALTWAEGGGKIRLGRKAGAMTNGRIQVRLPDGKTSLANRVIWLWMTGMPAPGQIEHANGSHTDMRWENLQARRIDHDPQHYLIKRDGQWFAMVNVGQELVQGPYPTSRQAAQVFASLLKSFAGITV